MTQPREITDEDRAHLAMFAPNTYSLALPRQIGFRLENMGLVEWVPPKFGGTNWAITDAGRAALRTLEGANSQSEPSADSDDRPKAGYSPSPAPSGRRA